MPRFDLPVRATDYVWLSLSVLFALIAVIGLYAWVLDAARSSYTLSDLFWVLFGLAVLLGSAALLVVLSWRRTCWGAQPGSNRETRELDTGE
jgi:hypothetical protein